MAKKNKIMVIASGYFNPLHKGHVEYLNRSKALGDFLFVIVNNDDQREMKGSAKFMDEKERAHIIFNLKSFNLFNGVFKNSIQIISII